MSDTFENNGPGASVESSKARARPAECRQDIENLLSVFRQWLYEADAWPAGKSANNGASETSHDQ